MPKEDEVSLSDQQTFAGKHAAADSPSLGDQATFAGRRTLDHDLSLGDQATLGGRSSAPDETLDDSIEIVDLATRYKIQGTLGQGGMGEVRLATDTRLDRQVAIKRLLGEAARSRMAVNRFLTEAQSIAALNHPNIVQIYDYGRAKDGPFLIMEFVDGHSLSDRCREGALPFEEAIEIACQLCDGLGRAHDLGIIHRDIKPANVLMTRNGKPKLTDFGLAKAESADTGMTQAGAVLGTPDFMPPEQRRDAALTDARSDLWSLAATLYQMVTGKSPRIIRLDLLPPSLQGVLGKALEDKKEDRYPNAAELRAALLTALEPAEGGDVAIIAGQCPSCETKNEAGRKFCRKCAASLEVPCLACQQGIQLWDEVCGHCGQKQTPLLEERRQSMASARSQAVNLLDANDFDRATQIATTLRDETDLRLQQQKTWSEPFLQGIESKRSEQLDRMQQLFSEAQRHDAAFDYPAAIQTLEQVPESLRTAAIPQQSLNVTTLLKRVQDKQREALRLEMLIKQQIESRQVNDLLSEVDYLQVFEPRDSGEALWFIDDGDGSEGAVTALLPSDY